MWGVVGPVDDFASVWQRGRWTLSEVPRELDVDVVSRRGGRHVLAVLIELDLTPVIVLNERFARTRLQQAALGHELSHVLLGDRGPLNCSVRLAGHCTERRAWLGAARLSVSSLQAEAISDRDLTIQDVAGQTGVPVELALLGFALHRYADDGSVTRGLFDHWAAWLGCRLPRRAA